MIIELLIGNQKGVVLTKKTERPDLVKVLLSAFKIINISHRRNMNMQREPVTGSVHV